MVIRDAVRGDLEAITQIYNSILLSSTAIYQDAPVDLTARTSWWVERVGAGYPVVVIEADGRVLGYASYGPFRTGFGYRFTVEGTIHIRNGERGRGLGSQLLAELIRRARAEGRHALVAGVDAENTASLAFLQRSGFQVAGRLAEVGFKFGRFLDLCFLVLPLNETAREAGAGSGGA